MRVTQSMLSSNMIRNLSTSYTKMGKYQDQLSTGKKVNRPSDDPVVAMKGIGYRSDLGKVEQFQRNLGEAFNWLDNSDDAYDHVGQALQRVRELSVDGANDTKTAEDKDKILSEIRELRKHIQSLSNSKFGDKYLFSGTNTDQPLYDDVTGYSNSGTLSGINNPVEIELFDGVTMNVNSNAHGFFSDVDTMLADIENGAIDFGNAIGQVDANMDILLTERANLGARQNRAELMENRLSTTEVNTTKMMSENEDIDYEKVITDMITQESVHRAALSTGARILQPSLVDFLR